LLAKTPGLKDENNFSCFENIICLQCSYECRRVHHLL